MTSHPLFLKLKDFFLKQCESWLHSWDVWWFRPHSVIASGFFRMVLCSVLFYMALQRSFHLDYFTDSSWIPRNLHFFVLPEMFRPEFTWFFWPDHLAVYFHILSLALLGLAALGIGHRLTLLVAWMIGLGFIQRNVAIAFGADHIGSILLFLAVLTNSFHSWSVLNLLNPQRASRVKNARTDILGSLGIRLVQIQMAVIYCYTGLEKLKGASWWDGTAFWNVIANPQQTTGDFTFLKHFPLFIAFMTFFTVAYEIFWPVAVNSERTRRLWLALGVLFHIGIGITLGLMVFSLIMISTYVFFLKDDEIQKYIVSNLDSVKKMAGSLKKVR